MLKLTDSDGRPVYIRPDKITAISTQPWDDNRPGRANANTRVHQDSKYFDVVESAECVHSLIP